jgi:hypothetical protein
MTMFGIIGISNTLLSLLSMCHYVLCAIITITISIEVAFHLGKLWQPILLIHMKICVQILHHSIHVWKKFRKGILFMTYNCFWLDLASISSSDCQLVNHRHILVNDRIVYPNPGILLLWKINKDQKVWLKIL